jgi:hypothetical protein
MRKHRTIKERFFEKVYKTSDCWIWTGALTKSGYGHMVVNGKVIDSHRISYELFHGKIPDGMLIMHSCDNKKCVNPDHLKIGTYSENMKDWHSKNPHKISENCTFKGQKHTDNTRSKLSKLALGNKWCVGRKLSQKITRDSAGRFRKLETKA